MATKRTQEPWMAADEFGRGMPDFTVNLLVHGRGAVGRVLSRCIRRGGASFGCGFCGAASWPAGVHGARRSHLRSASRGMRELVGGEQARAGSGAAAFSRGSGCSVERARGGARRENTAGFAGQATWMARRHCRRSGWICVGRRYSEISLQADVVLFLANIPGHPGRAELCQRNADK